MSDFSRQMATGDFTGHLYIDHQDKVGELAAPYLISWDSSIQMGRQPLDKPHGRRVDLTNTLNRAMKQRKGSGSAS